MMISRSEEKAMRWIKWFVEKMNDGSICLVLMWMACVVNSLAILMILHAEPMRQDTEMMQLKALQESQSIKIMQLLNDVELLRRQKPIQNTRWHVSPTGVGTYCLPLAPCSMGTAMDQSSPDDEIVMLSGFYGIKGDQHEAMPTR
jgi:hypothetical protein